MPPIATKAGGQCMVFPDVCLTPAPSGPPVPTPYPNLGTCADALQTATTVRAAGKEVLVISSRIPTSTGDEAGSAGGVMSGVFKGPIAFETGSNKVLAGGKRVVMHTSSTAHNGESPNAKGGLQASPSQTTVIAGS